MLVYFKPILSRQEAMAGPTQSPTTTVSLVILFARHITMGGGSDLCLGVGNAQDIPIAYYLPLNSPDQTLPIQ